MLQLTVLPVYVAHDEYMFIRMLQSYETTFALVGVQLRAAIAAIAEGSAAVAPRGRCARRRRSSRSSRPCSRRRS